MAYNHGIPAISKGRQQWWEKEMIERENIQKGNNKMAVVCFYISKFATNVSRQFTSQNTESVDGLKLKKKTDSAYAAYKKLILNSKDTRELTVKGWRKTIHAGGKSSKSRISNT